MTKRDMKKVPSFGIFIAAIAIALALGACTSSTSKTSTSTADHAPVGVETPHDPDGGGMEIPLDGTSLAAFEASLAQVKSLSSPEDYKTLESSINYLLMYDIGAGRDREKLAARLNGLTGYEVVARVNWRKPAPGKGKAEKGATDVKIIST